MKTTTQTITYNCDWCGEEYNPCAEAEFGNTVLDTRFFGSDIVNYLTIRPIVFVAGEPHQDVCRSCVNKGILKYAEGLK